MSQHIPPQGESSPSSPEFGPANAPQRPQVPPRVKIELPKVTPLVTYTFMALSVLVFLLQIASQYLQGVDIPAAYGMKVNEYILQGELWRLFTPMLLHGSFLHIGFNMYALYIFGPTLERHFGHWRFLALYVLSGFAGNVISFLFSPAPSLGASTAIFGLLGAQGVFLYQNRELFGQNARRALVNIITVAAINLFLGLSSGIDNWGHVGGLAGGLLFTWFGGPLLHVEGIYPALRLVDGRESGDVLRVAFAVGLIFAVLAAGIIYVRKGGLL